MSATTRQTAVASARGARIYAKVGVSSRAGLALFAHEHDLIAHTSPA